MTRKGDVRPAKGGAFRALLTRARPLSRHKGASNAGVSADHADVESLDDARWRLMESEARFRELLDSQHALIVKRTVEGHVAFANRAYCEAFGIRLEDVKDRRFAPQPLSTETGALLGDSVEGDIELHTTCNGQRWIRWETRALCDASGALAFHTVGRDVTDERRVAAELLEARDRAEAGSRAKSRFLAAMSHEIRTPMNGILGMANLLGETALTPEQESYRQAIDQSARTLLSIINEILDFSKIEAGKMQLEEAPFSLRAVLKRALDLLAIKAAENKSCILLTIDDDVPDVLIGDQARLGQIILNLVSNAVKFTRDGIIDVVVEQRDGPSDSDGSLPYGFKVRDTGIGMEPETIKLLFDDFEQAESVTGRRQSGTGLGLAISRRLAKAMGGDIQAEGALGKGATFTATLRFREVEAHVLCEKPIATDDSDRDEPIEGFCKGACILVVEDNEINALLARRICERAGARVVLAKDGRVAVGLVKDMLAGGATTRFDLILMDVFMPEMDGLAACRAVKGLFETSGEQAPPIIALTAHAFAGDRERCLAAGMDDYLAKPFDLRQLESVISRWVKPRRQHQAG